MQKTITTVLVAVACVAACLIAGCTHEQTDAARNAVNSPVIRDVAEKFPFGETILGAVSLALAALAEYQRRRARKTQAIAQDIVASVDPVLTEEAKSKIIQSDETRRFVRAAKMR
jgi:hypothetical protein